MLDNNMNDFVSFLDKLPSRYPQFIIKSSGDDVFMSMLNDTGSQVMQFLWFRKIESPFGFLHLVSVHKDGYEISKNHFTLNKNSRLHTWSQLSEIFNVINMHVASNSDYLNKTL